MDLEQLYLCWHHWNAVYFDGELRGPPRIEFSQLPNALGAFRPRSGVILVPLNFLTFFKRGPLVAELAAHILLHEMCHQWVTEHGLDEEDPHGINFGLIANRIGPRIGVSPCERGDRWCWPDHAAEGMGAYRLTGRSHGEVLLHLIETGRPPPPLQLDLFPERSPHTRPTRLIELSRRMPHNHTEQLELFPGWIMRRSQRKKKPTY